MGNSYGAGKFPDLFRNCVLWWPGQHIQIPGMTVETIIDGSYTVKKFTLPGNATKSVSWIPSSGITSVEYLVVGGGGTGGGYAGGGGGAGGFLTGTRSVTPGVPLTITVGKGGGDLHPNTSVENGANSVFADLIAYGGGHGAAGGGGTSHYATEGGSGGGGGNTNASFYPAGAGTSGQGNSGGTATAAGSACGGGAGGAGTISAGGIGLQSSITGTAVYYAGGGGCAQSKSGGLGGGGSGGTIDTGTGYTTSNSNPGTDGLGGGGAGGLTNLIPTGNSYGVPPKGGSGVVILRYLTAESSYVEISGDFSEFPIIPSGITVTPSGLYTKDDLGTNKSIIKFDGSTNYISLSDHNDWYFGTGDFTWCGWIRIPSLTNRTYNCICGQYVADGTRSVWYYYNNASGGLCWYNSGIAAFSQGSNSGWADDTWYFVAITRVGSVFTMYRNCVSIATMTNASASPDFAGEFRIGNVNSDAAQRYYGNLKDLFIYKGRALTVLELTLLMRKTHPVTGTGLVPGPYSYWRNI